MKSWRTAWAGIAAILTVVANAVKALTDNDPTTNVDVATTIAAIAAGIGLITARDNLVTSETSGAKEKESEMKAAGNLTLLLIVPLLLFTGCRGIGPNGPNTATGGFDPGTLFSIGKIMAGKEAERRYGVNPFDILGGSGTSNQAEVISFAEISTIFQIYDAGKTNAPMRDLFQILYLQKHPPVTVTPPLGFGSP